MNTAIAYDKTHLRERISSRFAWIKLNREDCSKGEDSASEKPEPVGPNYFLVGGPYGKYAPV